MADKNTKISITAPEYDPNDQKCILSMQKTLLLTLYEKSKINFNQYRYAVKLLENKSHQR